VPAEPDDLPTRQIRHFPTGTNLDGTVTTSPKNQMLSTWWVESTNSTSKGTKIIRIGGELFPEIVKISRHFGIPSIFPWDLPGCDSSLPISSCTGGGNKYFSARWSRAIRWWEFHGTNSVPLKVHSGRRTKNKSRHGDSGRLFSIPSNYTKMAPSQKRVGHVGISGGT
jgi:hypothetical protein